MKAMNWTLKERLADCVCSTTTTSAPEECATPNTIPVLQVIQRINKVKKVTDCSKKCKARADCEYYKWKNHKKANKRQCFLMKISFKPKKNWFSAPRDC